MTINKQPKEEWRWLALIAVLSNVVINYLPEQILPGASITAVSHKYNSLITPANYAFAIWGLIYFAMVVYSIYQVLPSQREEPLHDQLSQPMFFTNLLGIGWILSFRMEWIGISVLMIIGMLYTSIQLYIRVRDFVLRDDYSNWYSAPFSMYCAWLCLATLLNVSAWVVSLDLQEGIYQLAWSIPVILVISVLAVFVSFRCGDFVFPVVIAWGCFAIGVAQGSAHPALGAAATIGGLIPVVWMVTTWLKRVSYHHRVRANKFSF